VDTCYNPGVTIELSDEELGGVKITPAEARQDFAIGLYTARRASLGKAAKIAGISGPEFLHELGRRGLSINYSESDFRHDLQLLDRSDSGR
jgi:predicted HTH domain antitoxin